MAGNFARRIIDWHRRHGRHELPWQRPATPYRVWISEIMLQQTRVETVLGYFERFVERFPDIRTLAGADTDEVLSLWAGLGYYARARNLHRAARICLERHGGTLPDDFDALLALPGIGRSTAGAIRSLAAGERRPILDGNVKRVLARHAGIEGWPGHTAIQKQLWSIAEERTPRKHCATYNQALMDLGATVCLRTPRCDACPVSSDCVARNAGTTDRIPAPKPRRDRPQRETRVLVLQDGEGRVWLERRPAQGIWGGLWSLPEFPDEAALQDWLQLHLDHSVEPEALEPVEHGFTHFRLTLHPRRVLIRDHAIGGNTPGYGWHHPDHLPGGLPAPIARILDATRMERAPRTESGERAGPPGSLSPDSGLRPSSGLPGGGR